MFFFYFDENGNKTEIPGFEQTMKPILRALQEHGGEASNAELNHAVIKIMGLPEEVTQIMHNGSNTRSELDYRMAWGKTYLKKYGLITNVARGVWAFTDAFDGDIDKLDPNEIVLKVRSDNAGDKDNSADDKTLTGFESALAFENMIGALLKELAAKEGKPVHYTYSDTVDYGYDMVLPCGVEDISQETKCVIKYVANPSKQSAAELQRIMKRELDKFSSNDSVLYITNVEMPENMRDQLTSNVSVWDRKDLLARIDPDAAYAQYLINPQQALIKDVVTKDVETTDSLAQQKKKEKEKYINQAKAAYIKQDMVLFLGAGVSIDGGIPLWSTLIKTLHVSMLNGLTEDKNLSLEQREMMQKIALNNEMESPLMQMRYIRSGFSSEDYYKMVHAALYNHNINLDTELLNAIAKISMAQRGGGGVKSIITYNFDDLLEQKFERSGIPAHIIYNEKGRQKVNKLNIYHVHGYLPNDYSKTADEPNLIFSEEDYHRVYRDAYSWSSLVQLNALRENTCLFIGCSLSDPNLRRLLDVAVRGDETPRHYAFLKKTKICKVNNSQAVDEKVIEIYQKLDDNIQTAYYQKLGLNIIWIDNFEEIPVTLKGFLI